MGARGEGANRLAHTPAHAHTAKHGHAHAQLDGISLPPTQTASTEGLPPDVRWSDRANYFRARAYGSLLVGGGEVE